MVRYDIADVESRDNSAVNTVERGPPEQTTRGRGWPRALGHENTALLAFPLDHDSRIVPANAIRLGQTERVEGDRRDRVVRILEQTAHVGLDPGTTPNTRFGLTGRLRCVACNRFRQRFDDRVHGTTVQLIERLIGIRGDVPHGSSPIGVVVGYKDAFIVLRAYIQPQV